MNLVLVGELDLHICMLTSEFPPTIGGVSHYVYNLSTELIRKGHKVTVITRGSWKGLQTNCAKGISVYRLPFLRIYPFHVEIHKVFLTRIFKLLEPDFDLVHVHHPLSPLIHTSLPIVVTVHSSLGLSESGSIEFQNFYSSVDIPRPLLSLIRSYFRKIEQRIIENADVTTTVSTALIKELKEHYGFDAISLNLLGNGVDTALFTPGNAKENAPYILYTGRLSWNKGLIDLVKSAKYILNEHPEVSFVLTGRGPLENDLRKLVTKMKMSREFSFVGYVDTQSLVQYYQNAKVFVLPSYYEGLPTTLLEAMACGIPVVTTSVGGIPEVVVNGKNGFIIPIKDPTAIASAVSKLLENEKQRVNMGRIARNTVEKNYSWDRVASEALKYYESITK